MIRRSAPTPAAAAAPPAPVRGGDTTGTRAAIGALAISPELTVDVRRAVWLPESQSLVIADTHLGYAWTQRQRGQLLPLAPDDTVARLEALLADYPARTVILLGDVVHAATPTETLAAPLRDLCGRVVTADRKLVLVLGNHDHGLPECLRAWRLPVTTVLEHTFPGWLFVHGDRPLPAMAEGVTVLSGHEHPSLRLGDGVATSAKVPAFLLNRKAVLLPAFSNWAAGTVSHGGGFLGPVAQQFDYTEAVACFGNRLLRLPFPLVRRMPAPPVENRPSK